MEIGGADVNLTREVDGFARGGADHIANDEKSDKGKNGSSSNFSDEYGEIGLATSFGLCGASGL